MIVDALLAAEPTLRLAERTEDSREFVRLDDTIIKVGARLDIFKCTIITYLYSLFP